MISHLPKDLYDQVLGVLRSVWKLEAKECKAEIEHLTSWAEKQHLNAAGSLYEQLNNLFNVSGLGLSRSYVGA